MMAIGAGITFSSLFALPLMVLSLGTAWWVWLAGIAAFATILSVGIRIWCWAIDEGFNW